MKTKRKLVPKDDIMRNVGKPEVVGVTGSCVSHVGEGSRSSIPAGNQLECLVGRVVDGRHMGNINDAGLCSAGNVIDEVGRTFHVDEFIGICDLQTLGTSLNDTRKRSRDTTTMSSNTDGNDCSSSKRPHTSVDHTISHLRTSDAVFVPPADPLLNTATSSHLHVPNERNPTQESVASLSANRKRTTDDDSVFPADTSNVHANDFSVRGNRTGPPLEYKNVGKCDHSCEHCGARFWYEERIKDNRRKTRPAYHRCCMAGRVVLRTYQIYPEYIQLLLRDRHFMENIRAYNHMFSMTSLGARVDDSINIGRGPYVFKISGQLYHWLGSLCPAEGDPPRFLQLYVYDTENEVDNRMAHFGGDNSGLRRDIVEGLIELLDNHNALVQLFRTAREKLLESEVPPFKVRLFNVVGAREYELPTGDMLGAIVYEPGPNAEMDFDIVIEQRIGQPQRVSKLHPSYMALQFPLLFVYGEDGYSKDMKMVRVPGVPSDEDRRLTMKAYYSYVLHDRVNSFNYLSRTGRLFQQYMVTDFELRGDSDGSDCGGRLILPQSFTGGPLVYTVEFQKRGLPHCHTLVWIDEASRTQNQEEIDNYISAELPSEEVDPEGHRVVAEFMIHGPCGEICPTAACMKNSSRCTKHFPKEYCHNTYIDAAGFVHYRRRDTRITTTKQNVELDNGYVVPYNLQLLKTFYAHINVEHCGWTMLIKYLFKYISKGTDKIVARITRSDARNYPDTPSTSRQPQIVIDEIKNYLDSRYIGPHEACWRLFEFDIHYREPAVQVLAVHGENMQRVGGDKEWETTLIEASSTATPSELRTLLAHIFTHCQVSNPSALWRCTWNLMSNDIPYVASISLGIPNLHIDPSELENYTKYEFEACLNHCSRSLTDFGISLPPENLMSVLRNRLLMEEKSYNRDLLAIERDKLIEKLNNCQRDIFNIIMHAITTKTQELIFVYGHGGTGKTFLWKTIIYALRAEGKIVLAVASSGIASLLLPSGRTAHSRFKLPLDLNDSSVCSITKNTQLATLLKETDLIIWDESPMNDRRCFETLDRTLRDILDAPTKLFGGKPIMLGGDFRQTLPVKKKASRTEIINSSIAESYLWPSFRLFVLTENMRLTQRTLSDTEKREVSTFAEWLLNVGDGTVGVPDDTDPANTSWIEIPPQFQIPDDENGVTKLINFIYDEHTLLHPTAKDLQDKAIVCPKNDTADIINAKVMNMLPGHTTSYISSDEAMPHGHDGGEVELLYPTEYLNTLNFAGIPPHELNLKIGTPIMLLRNINIVGGLCNGTRMIIRQLLPKVIEAQIITGTRISQKAYIPRIPLTMKDPKLPFIFKRKQFPVRVCYAMTINKSQGQPPLMDLRFSPMLMKTIPQQIQKTLCIRTMDLANVGDTSQQDRGKMILMEPKITYISELSTTDYDKTIEAIVYRKWTSKTTKTRTPTKFCCILIDKEGYPIQANMSLRDAEYFDQLLQLRKAYRFSGFSCEPTDKWERTLPTETSLIFGRFLQVEEIPATEFPEHYFNFAAYNELQDRLTARNPILTDYIGRIRAIRRIEKKGDAMSSQKTLRVIDIENLSGNVIGCTLWNEMATNFDEREYNSMEKPVIIAVSSCYINRYHDPNIPETRQIKALCPQLPNTGPMLEIVHQRYEDMEREKMRNRFPLAILHDVDPQNYQFDSPQKLSSTVSAHNDVAMVNDGSATTSITCFSEAHTFTTNVNEVVEQLVDKNPYILPPNLQQLQGTTHIFQFHFDSMTSSRRPDFVLDRVFPKTQLTLPPPEPTETVETHITPETQQTYDNKEPEQPDKPEEITQTQSPISQMTTSPPIAETDTDTPTYKHISDTKNTDTNAPKLSIKKPLFQDEPHTSNPQTPKKQKTKSVDK
ncbi:DNA helicase [Tanacetum coccineum]